MKASKTTLESLADIERIETTGHVRRVGSQMLLALARKEVSATDVEAAAKMIAAISMNMQSEVKLALTQISMREKGAKIVEIAHFGQALVAEAASK